MKTLLLQLELIVTIFSLFYFEVSQSLSCVPCHLFECEQLVCKGMRVPNPCGCCQVCAKQEGEVCGGPWDVAGTCDVDLTCVKMIRSGDMFSSFNERGICKSESDDESDCPKSPFFGCNLVDGTCECGQSFSCKNPYRFNSQHLCLIEENSITNEVIPPTLEACANIRCQPQPTPACPDDSRLDAETIPLEECCPASRSCECKECISTCPAGARKLVITKGTGRPGSCCDEFECLPPVDECDTVRCLYVDIACPSDSEVVPGPLSPDGCCRGIPSCRCLNTNCPLPSCPDGVSFQILYKSNGNPGSCCDEYVCSNSAIEVGCSVNGSRHQNGDYYQDHCQRCQCKLGISHCEPQSCPKLPCEHVTMETGACCPTCVAESPDYIFEDLPPILQPLCWNRDKTQAYQVGQNWTSDACTFCTCEKGGIRRCKAAFCKEPTVISTTFPCPSLSNCFLEETDCQNGMARDENGCAVCQCSDGEDFDSCPSMDTCQLQCPRGYVTDDVGCPMCKCKPRKCKQSSVCTKQCPYGYKRNKKGCYRCKCRHCPLLDTCHRKCTTELATNVYGCKLCRCKRPGEFSVLVPAPSKNCFDPVSQSYHDDGETWSSDCYICVCRGGEVMCDLLKCPIPNCDNPRFTEGACCATCPDDSIQISQQVIPQSLSCSEHIKDPNLGAEGEVIWAHVCNKITCHDGILMARAPLCLPAACENPLFDETSCCPKCIVPTQSGSCLLQKKSCLNENGTVYEDGTEFKTDPCTSCKCDNGIIKCFTEKCSAKLRCTHPILRRGQCCPECLDTLPLVYQSCEDNAKMRLHGEEWISNSSECQVCVCIAGKASCEEACCPPVPSNCKNTQVKNGTCCVECVSVIQTVVNPTVLPSASSSTSLLIPLVVASVIFLVITAILAIYWKKLSCTRAKGKLEITKSKDRHTDYLTDDPHTRSLLHSSNEQNRHEDA